MTFAQFLAGSIATLALIIAVVAVPLILRKIPPNGFYGFRTAKTLGDRTIWFEANAYAGKAMIVAAIAMFSLSWGLIGLAASGMPKNALATFGIIFEIAPMLVATIFAFRYLRKL